MSSKKDSTASNGSATKYEARLCHVVKRPDFDGYGFNLHAEKGRPGQYIGKVDDGSPAEAAGLRQGDRIIEVNGTNITTETHKKVVELIKGVLNETKLLVIDPRADAAELKAAIAKSKNGSNGVDVNDNSKQQPAAEGEHMMTNGTKDSFNENKHDVNGTSNNNSNEDVNNKKNSSSSSSANNNVDTSANKSTTAMMMMTNGDASAKKQPVDQIIEDTKALSVASPAKTMTESNGSTKPAMNGSNGSANGSASKEGPKLNLNMTAAELRAQLAARKKYDPKNDVCDLRKKYEIIQKM
ncbi:Na(+)/H(+) exchange regulatory cofactor NHE-RF1 [Ochlerotatus camptorhynchus]|uniref:Na(+)/H(+) exchange regulatory cofactor NHE-RF1 n=1 Tax=Ochlerotatus camptorhynchus TaxID=644619 RepID=UPI0031D936A3